MLPAPHSWGEPVDDHPGRPAQHQRGPNRSDRLAWPGTGTVPTARHPTAPRRFVAPSEGQLGVR